MSDSAAAKLAAGRKMLKEFQNKKKMDPIQTGTSSPDQNSPPVDEDTAQHNIALDTNTNDGPEGSAYTDTEYPNNVIDYENNSNNEYPILELPGMANNAYVSTAHREVALKPQENLAHEAASNFFDKLSTDNNMWPDQSTSSDTRALENGVPLAGFLFSNQSRVLDRNKVQARSSNLNNRTGAVPKSKSTSRIVEDSSSEGSAESSKDVKTRVEISKLQQQLQFHIKTVEFLVSEKSELLEKVNEYEKMLSEGKSGSDDLGGRLNISRQRASHLEMEVKTLKKHKKEAEERANRAHELGSIARANEGMLGNQIRDLEEEIEELKTILNERVLENKNLAKKVDELNQLISNPLRFSQDSPASSPGPLFDPQLAEKYLNLQELVENLQEQVSELESDKRESSIQYQEYVRQLNQQIQTGNTQHADLVRANEKLAYREVELLRQMNNLEKQMQALRTQIHKDEEKLGKTPLDTPTLESLRLLSAENEQLKNNLLSMEYSWRSTTDELNQCRSQVEELTQTIHQVQSEKPDSAKLNAAMESDKLAAQKATAQNNKMKLSIEHLESALEHMTNSKLELAELLQAEKNLSKTLTLKLVETEETLKETRSHLHAKDEEMIRLQAVSSDLQKEILKQAQVADRLSHYEAQGQSSELLQSELQSTQSVLQTLSDENEKLKKSLRSKDIPETHSDCNHHSEPKGEVNQASDAYTPTMPTAEAMSKLQERFTKLMQEVAELSDEKQKLEHIVLQLQGETETICEYIALYQKQRGVLKQREIERNNQIDVLSKEREHIKAQLESLRGLITEFVPAHSSLVNDDSPKHKTQTAEKIMSLLTEIKGSHLIEPDVNCVGLENFHPCPCCSGKLIIV